MPYVCWVTEQRAYAGVSVVAPFCPSGHVANMVLDKANGYIFAVDHNYDEALNLLPSKLHRFHTVFDWEAGIPHTSIETASAAHQYIDVAVAAGAIMCLREDKSGSPTKYYLEKRDPATLNLLAQIEVFLCQLTTVGNYVWLIGVGGVMKRLDVASMTYDVEVSYPGAECDRAVYDPVMDVLVVPRKLVVAQIVNAQTGAMVGDAPFPWAGPGQMAHVAAPPHGPVGDYDAPVAALVEYDVGLQRSKIVLFSRDTVNKTYLPMYVEIPFNMGAIPPHNQMSGFCGMSITYVTMDNRPPGNDAECAADPALRGCCLVYVARNGNPPSAAQLPLEYFVGRRVNLMTYQSAMMFANGLPECNPYKRCVLTTNDTAKLWVASWALANDEQKAYPNRIAAI